MFFQQLPFKQNREAKTRGSSGSQYKSHNNGTSDVGTCNTTKHNQKAFVRDVTTWAAKKESEAAEAKHQREVLLAKIAQQEGKLDHSLLH